MRAAAPQVGQCTPSIRCAGRGFQQAGAGVVAIYAVDMRVGAMGLCTGARRRARGCARR
jgi:hypothetical protein